MQVEGDRCKPDGLGWVYITTDKCEQANCDRWVSAVGIKFVSIARLQK